MKALVSMVPKNTLLTKFQELLTKFDPNASVFYKDGYYFSQSQNFKGNRMIDYPGSNYHEKNFDIHIKEIIKSFLKDHHFELGQILATEYKIHLMPKFEYILLVIKILLDACSKDEALSKLIHQIKIRSASEPPTAAVTIQAPAQSMQLPSAQPAQATKQSSAQAHDLATGQKGPTPQIMPTIVIYPALGKENAQAALNKICKILFNFNLEQLSVELTPRYNTKVMTGIFYGQGGGDLKKAMVNPKEFLTESQVHFNWGDPKLIKPTCPVSNVKSHAEELQKHYDIFQTIFWNMLRGIPAFKKLELNTGTNQCPGQHFRLWIDSSNKFISQLNILFALFEEYQMLYSTKIKNKNAFLAIWLPNDTSFIAQKDFKQRFEQFFFLKLKETMDGQPALKKRKVSGGSLSSQA